MLSYGLHEIPCGKGEDRLSVNISHTADGLPQFASFCVFDGHGGSKTAEFCQRYFSSRVVSRVRTLVDSSKLSLREFIATRCSDFDDVICESIELSCREMDINAKVRDSSGCTLNSLFVVHDPSSRCTRLYCGNVGDSRCMLFTANSNPIHCKDAMSLVSGSSLPVGVVEAGKVYYLSEDHKLSNPKEKKRLSLGTSFNMHCRITPVNTSSRLRTDSQDTHISDEQYRNSSLHLRDAVIWPVILPYDDIPTITPEEYADLRGDEGIKAFISGSRKIRREESCVKERFTARGEPTGVEAVFGRYNVSLTMTRSIGDKFGPRRCVPVPDVKLAIVGPNSRARAVIASDGVWDVVDAEWIANIVFETTEPAGLALRIATEAMSRRISAAAYMDDISVIVVEIDGAAIQSPLKVNDPRCFSCVII